MAAGAGEQYGKCAERLPPGTHAGGSGRSAGPVRGGPPGAKGAEMKNTHVCPKCGSRDVVRIPDHPSRYASGSNIYTSKYTLMGKIPVIRYVCCGCGYVENWVESPMELVQLHQTFGDR